MITSEIAANQAFAQVNRIDSSHRPTNDNDPVVRTAKGEPIDGVKTEISAFSALPIQKFNAEFNDVIKSIRIADQAMGEIGANIEQMEAQVEIFVKQYPPYPAGSEERGQLINNFAALRRMINRLTIPPDPFAQEIIGPPKSDANVDRWEIKVSGKQLGPAIRRQPVHSGAEGLNLPELAPEASDGEIAQLGSELGRARQALITRRAALAEDTLRVIRHIQKAV